MNFIKMLLVVFALILTQVARASEFVFPARELSSLKYLPVLEAGRVKPYDTFARETLQLITGKSTYGGKDATEIVFTWMLLPSHWDEQKIVQVRFNEVKTALGLNVTENNFSPKELLNNPKLSLLVQELNEKREAKAKLNNYFQAVQRLESQLTLYNAIVDGGAFHVLPSVEINKWYAINELPEEVRTKFGAITQAFVETISGKSNGDTLSKSIAEFVGYAKTQSAHYADFARIEKEVHYNTLHPFQWAWILYLVAALTVFALWLAPTKKWLYAFSWSALVFGFLMHTYGFALRIYLTGRPPVSNMYESVVWVSWGAVVFAMVFECLYRKRFLILASSVVGVLCLIMADIAPTVLDSSIQPLEPVLRSNLWLTVHVLTITLSYAAFFLAFILGDVGLVYFLRGETKFKTEIQTLTQSIYRCLQVGTVLLAAGTILGGVWADYSWGRFWGWDPKETWAFIALMGYMALMHARLAGYIKQFGLHVGAVVSFSLVIMAWYGVNYVLGAGLHSYGFGGGGVQYVSAFVAAHMAFVFFVYASRRSGAKKIGSAR